MRGILILATIALLTFLSSSSGQEIQLPEIYRCGQYQKKCEKCVKAKCLYCYTDRSCKPWTYGILPPPALCALSEARWGVCWLNYMSLIIAGCMFFGFAIIAASIAVYCLCFRSGGKKTRLDYARDEEKWEREREQRRLKASERKKERENKAKELRTKYGLNENGYERFN